MSTMVLGSKHTRPTARLLAKELEADYAEVFIETDCPKHHLLVRYGNSTTMARGNILINSQESVKSAADKPTCRARLLRNHVPCPAVWASSWNRTTGRPEIIPEFPATFGHGEAYIARPRYHSRGQDFNIVRSEAEAKAFILRGYYLQEIVKKATEFRLFMFNSKIMEASQKVQARANADMMIRNHRRGWNFMHIPVANLSVPLKDACRKASNAIDINFCAIDCCLDEAGNPWILEINSAPGLIGRKVVALAERIRTFVREIERSDAMPDEDYEDEDEEIEEDDDES